MDKKSTSSEETERAQSSPALLSRRHMLTTIGAISVAGMAITASGLFPSGKGLNTVEAKSNPINLNSYGVRGDGQTNDAPGLSDIFASFQSVDSELCLPSGIYRIATNLVIPGHVTLIFASGAVFQIESGVTVTFHGGLKAALVTIFSGEGIVQGPINVPEVYPQWWGARGDGVADDSAAWQAALHASNRVSVPAHSRFRIGNIELHSKQVSGSGVIKKISGKESAFHVLGQGTVITGIHFQAEPMSGQPNTEIKLGEGASDVRISDCTFQSNIYSAVAGAVDSSQSGGGDYTQQAKGIILSNNIFKGYVRPLYLHSVSNITITGNVIRDCMYDAIRLRENDGFCLIDGNQFINIGDPTWPDEQTRDAIDTYWSGKDLTITNNIVDTVAYIGFDLKGIAPNGSYNSSRVIVANNQIYRARYSGIKVSYGSNDNDLAPHAAFYQISGNIINECNQNNRNGAGGVGTAGILFNKVKHANILDNFVISCYGRGIFVNNPQAKSKVGGNEEHKNRSIRIVGNMCINNGEQSKISNCAGIMSLGTGYTVIAQNICENDPDYANFNNQGVGIFVASAGTEFTTYKSHIVRDNICRNNVHYQISINGSEGIAVFDGNIQEGTNASYGHWHHQRSQFSGIGVPIADGAYQKGDRIMNIAPTRTKNISHWICIEGGNPGMWHAYGCGWGTLSERPQLTSNDAGYQYKDITTSQSFLWTGNDWVT